MGAAGVHLQATDYLATGAEANAGVKMVRGLVKVNMEVPDFRLIGARDSGLS